MILRKLTEADLTIPVLYILYTRGEMTTRDLKYNLLYILNPGGNNLDPLLNRNDTAIHQITTNIISHRTNSTNIICRGLIDYNSRTGVLSITDYGISYLDNYNVSRIISELN